MRAALAAALHHSWDVGPCTNDAPRGQTTYRETEEPELFTLFEEELGGTRPDRLSDVRPQERVQRRTVEQLVVAALGLPTLDAPVPLVVEQLADVLPLVEAKEREEDARMGQVEDMMFSGQSVSAAGKPGANGPRLARRRGEGKGRKRRSFRRRPCVMLLQFQQSFVEYVEAPQFQFIDSGYFSCFAETGIHSAKLCRRPEIRQVLFLDRLGHARRCALTGACSWTVPKNCGGSAVAVGAVLGTVVDAPVVGYDRCLLVQTVCKWRCRSCSFFDRCRWGQTVQKTV